MVLFNQIRVISGYLIVNLRFISRKVTKNNVVRLVTYCIKRYKKRIASSIKKSLISFSLKGLSMNSTASEKSISL